MSFNINKQSKHRQILVVFVFRLFYHALIKTYFKLNMHSVKIFILISIFFCLYYEEKYPLVLTQLMVI